MPNSGPIPCTRCWQCDAERVDTWVGRCIAEKTTTAHSHYVTLTYGTSEYQYSKLDLEARSRELVYQDVQEFLKRLRFHTEGLRFFAVGEYGKSNTRRAHWHIAIFWKGEPAPGIRLREERFMHAIKPGVYSWPHGFSYWDTMSYQSVAYGMKYITKTVAEEKYEATKFIGFSKYPELGHDYLVGFGKDHARNGLIPNRRTFVIPERVLDRNGKRKEFYVWGAARRTLLNSYVDEFYRLNPKGIIQSDVLREYEVERELYELRKAGGVPETEVFSIKRAKMRRKERGRGNYAGIWNGSFYGPSLVGDPFSSGRNEEQSDAEKWFEISGEV
uniref:Replication-associated protein ORF2/G2P domain-containing protein n=1 Tax=uncultured prokaryote TaxID=198431 RepID=A0A0H5Q665_9ZZZZ|nr:hypothetical protein [uncultured prokaryote]